MAMSLEPTVYPQQYCRVVSKVVEGEVDREKSGVTTSQNGPGKVLQRHRHWHMIESSGRNWSDVQQHSASTTILGQETNDNENDIILEDIIMKSLTNI